jgi:hypothetical protein
VEIASLPCGFSGRINVIFTEKPLPALVTITAHRGDHGARVNRAFALTAMQQER